jgi:hypothetical protein
LFLFQGVQINEDKLDTKECHPSFVGKICNEGIVAWMVIANLEFETIFTSYIVHG